MKMKRETLKFLIHLKEREGKTGRKYEKNDIYIISIYIEYK
jgi:hypothetical protein